MVFKQVKPDPTFETWDDLDRWVGGRFALQMMAKSPRRRKELSEEIRRVREAHQHLTPDVR